MIEATLRWLFVQFENFLNVLTIANCPLLRRRSGIVRRGKFAWD